MTVTPGKTEIIFLSFIFLSYLPFQRIKVSISPLKTFLIFRFITDSQKKSHTEDGEDNDVKREEFRHPRNCLLNFASDFYKLCSGKLNDINKVGSEFLHSLSMVKTFRWKLIENCICYGPGMEKKLLFCSS